ncbi:MAG: hypothetical protein GY716_02140 [bacterium]|nr:hypothetical protein [bacterium]
MSARVPASWWVYLAVAGLLGALAFGLIAHRVSTDIELHAQFIVDCIEQRIVPVDFVYYLSVATLGGFARDPQALIPASIAVLTLAFVAKLLVTTRCVARWSFGALPSERPGLVLALGAGLAVLFCLPLPGMNWYLGQFPPNQWHNSTTIAAMPFAVLLFHHATEYLRGGSGRHLTGTALFLALSMLTKPSLFFAFAPAFPLIALLTFGADRRFVRALGPLVLGSALFAAYFAVIFLHPGYERIAESADAGLALGWFQPWRSYTPSVPLSAANSLLLPGLFVLGYRREAWSDVRVCLAATMLLVGLLLFSFVQETGARSLHGNLSWQNIISNYLLHAAVVACFVRTKLRDGRWTRFDGFLVAVFGVQVLSGVAYVVRTIVERNYL